MALLLVVLLTAAAAAAIGVAGVLLAIAADLWLGVAERLRKRGRR